MKPTDSGKPLSYLYLQSWLLFRHHQFKNCQLTEKIVSDTCDHCDEEGIVDDDVKNVKDCTVYDYCDMNRYGNQLALPES